MLFAENQTFWPPKISGLAMPLVLGALRHGVWVDYSLLPDTPCA